MIEAIMVGGLFDGDTVLVRPNLKKVERLVMTQGMTAQELLVYHRSNIKIGRINIPIVIYEGYQLEKIRDDVLALLKNG